MKVLLFFLSSITLWAENDLSLYPGPSLSQDYLQVEGDRMFTPIIFGDTEENLLAKKLVFFKDEPFASLRENFLSFLKLETNDLLGCEDDNAHKDVDIVLTFDWLKKWVHLTRVPFTRSNIQELEDPYGLKLFSASSFLGRCHFSASQSLLETLYSQISTNYINDEVKHVIHYPNLLSYYFNVDLEEPFSYLYLYSIRHALLWGYFQRNEMLPKRFELNDKILSRDLEPRGLSFEGFLGTGETLDTVLETDKKLLSILSCDNEKCTSRMLGHFLLKIVREYLRLTKNELKTEVEIFVGNTKYRVSNVDHGADIQVSPFKDGLQGIGDYKIENLSHQDPNSPNGIFVAGIVPFLILTRGFFEGFKTPYRVDPVHVVNLMVSDNNIRKSNMENATQFLKNHLSREENQFLIDNDYYSFRTLTK